MHPRTLPLAILLVLSVLDVAMTAAILSGGGAELNPLAARLWECAGIFGIASLKCVGISTYLLCTRLLVAQSKAVTVVALDIYAVCASTLPFVYVTLCLLEG